MSIFKEKTVKRIVIRILSMFIPIKSWRKAFRSRLNGDMFGSIKEVFTEVKVKRNTVLENKDVCQIVVLGSSHGAYGINPEFISENCFNLCSNSQDLFTAEHVLAYMQERLPKLKKVIFILDVFTRGWCLERTSAENICASYQYLYGICYPLFRDKRHYLKYCKKIDQKELSVKENKNGYLNPPKLEFNGKVETRVQLHLREHDREQSQYGYLGNMIKAVYDHGGEMDILIMPVRKDYQELIPKDLLLSEAKQLVKGTNAEVWDFSLDPDFTEEDFCDFDHLNSMGAEKLSRKVKGLLQ